jgi:hypothetical protein
VTFFAASNSGLIQALSLNSNEAGLRLIGAGKDAGSQSRVRARLSISLTRHQSDFRPAGWATIV